MKKTIFFLFTVSLMASCGGGNTPAMFHKVDFTFSNGKDFSYTIVLDSAGNYTFHANDSLWKPGTTYKGTASQLQLDSIDHYVQKIFNEKRGSASGDTCSNCAQYSIIVSSQISFKTVIANEANKPPYFTNLETILRELTLTASTQAETPLNAMSTALLIPQPPLQPAVGDTIQLDTNLLK